MALTASIAIPSATQFRIKLFQNQSHQLERYLPVCVPRKTFHIFSKKVSMTHSGEPDKGKELRRLMREKLKEAMPTSVKDFPWKKAEGRLLERLLFLGQEAMKWSLILFFIFTSISDVIFSLSINQELLIPVGLFAGCILTDFLKEILQEAFRSSQAFLQHLLLLFVSQARSIFCSARPGVSFACFQRRTDASFLALEKITDRYREQKRRKFSLWLGAFVTNGSWVGKLGWSVFLHIDLVTLP
ncbi:Embryo defective protein [Quillaja saponaria]|uniref:Embryo defective protein n=1 Tax=Quillaja saponaria TaxID=32244 RepID=A0AAD7PSN1_QUISA|nr:Embryo defective protein [Quillaja saponaria]